MGILDLPDVLFRQKSPKDCLLRSVLFSDLQRIPVDNLYADGTSVTARPGSIQLSVNKFSTNLKVLELVGQEILERTTSPTCLTLFNNAASVA
jgi:hypothetical protein